MKLRPAFLPVAVGLMAALAVVPAYAHFVWVAVEKDSGGQSAAHVWFSELAEPDSAELLDRVAAVKVWRRTAAGDTDGVTLAKQIQGDGGAWVGKVPEGAQALSAHIIYGVLSRGDQTFLLQYHAKYLDSAAARTKTLARDEKLKFDIVPHMEGERITLEVLFHGKPVEAADVIVFDPTAAETTAKTDAQGRCELKATRPGLYSIRAKWVVKEPGEHDGKAYPQINHYSTLALRVSAGDVPQQTLTEADNAAAKE